MKRLFIIIGILAIIFFGMVIYKNTANNTNSITIQEVQNIEGYISKIYMWKETTNEALPTFEDINSADDLWVWEVVKRNLEEYEISYEQIQLKAKELFGEDFQKQFPKEGTSGLAYEQEDKYIATETDLDMQEDVFLLNHIDKVNGEYIIEIIEYLQDYSSEDNIIVKNTKGEEIGTIGINESETKIQELVKNNISKFTKKKIYLKQQEMIIKKVEQIND